MAWPAFPGRSLSPEQTGQLLARLTAQRQIWGPRAGSDGRWRLQPLPVVTTQPRAALTFLPLKKLLFPDGDPLWTWQADSYAGPVPPPGLLLIDVALCELQALAWLDRAFAEDELYCARRAALLVVGAPCEPSGGCACQPDGLLPAGDLFRADNRWWALSPAGSTLLAEVCGAAGWEARPLPGPVPDVIRSHVDAALFAESAGASLWDEAAARCLACGACSAVCPTCVCYEVLDDGHWAGSVTRRRVWDNCFFPEHARVAGGYDFRPGRGARLRFRFEHKRLGFGSLRGICSCVGCGRCRRACPVGIELEPVARRLAGGAGA